jgi:hypothetical protein
VTVFLVIALLAALLHVVLGAFVGFLGTAITYAITGLLCGLVLRTRLVGGARRMLVVCFFAIGFTIAGVWTTSLLAAEASMLELVGGHGFLWGLVGLAATTPYLGPGWRLAVPLFAAACFAAAGGLSIWLLYKGLGSFDAALLCVNPVLVCLAAGAFDQVCASIPLESPQEEFDRLRVRFEFRLR